MNRTEVTEKRVLVVDDDLEVAKLMARSLDLYGAAAQVTIALSAEDARQKMLVEPFDLVISDMHMGVLDGLTLLKEIGTLKPGIRLVLVTGDISPELAQRAGVHRCISKPCPAELLATTVRDLLSHPEGQAKVDVNGLVAADSPPAPSGERSENEEHDSPAVTASD